MAEAATVESSPGRGFIFRALKSREELEPWSLLCAEAFASKANPPPASYFLSHCENDDYPSSLFSNVFVAEEEETRLLVSSVRVFTRKLHMASLSTQITVAGVGEVCTLEAFRKRGLSKRLLQFALDESTSNRTAVAHSFSGSLLHCSTPFIPFYESLGYLSLKTCWCSIALSVAKFIQIDDEEEIEIRSMLHSEFGDVAHLSDHFNSHFDGPVVRSERYSSKWISSSCTSSHVALGAYRKSAPLSSPPCAYAVTCLYNGEVQLSDFGCDAFLLGKGAEVARTSDVKGVIVRLLSHALSLHHREAGAGEPSSSHMRLPLPVANFFGLHYEESDVLVDLGWMYKHFGQVGEGRGSDHQLTEDSPFVFWKADSF